MFIEPARRSAPQGKLVYLDRYILDTSYVDNYRVSVLIHIHKINKLYLPAVDFGYLPTLLYLILFHLVEYKWHCS